MLKILFGSIIIILSVLYVVNVFSQQLAQDINNSPPKAIIIANNDKPMIKDRPAQFEIQRQMSKSTKTIADFTIILSIATLFLVIVAIAQWILSRNTLIATKRAFIFLRDIKFKEIIDKMNPTFPRWEFFTIWENSGETPTKDLTISLGCDLRTEMLPLPAHLPDDFDFPCNDFKDIPAMIGPKAFITITSIPLPRTNMEQLKLAIKPYHHQYKFFLWGEAKYHDVFWCTRKHITQFCVELTFNEQLNDKPPIMSFNYCEKHNYAD